MGRTVTEDPATSRAHKAQRLFLPPDSLWDAREKCSVEMDTSMAMVRIIRLTGSSTI